MGIAHEYAHCYVNPVVEGNRGLLKDHAFFFKLHKNIPQSYNVDYAVINEYFVRAFQIRFMEANHELFPEFDLSAEYERQRKMFIFIEDFVEFLKKFEKSRTTFGDCYKNSIEGILGGRESS